MTIQEYFIKQHPSYKTYTHKAKIFCQEDMIKFAVDYNNYKSIWEKKVVKKASIDTNNNSVIDNIFKAIFIITNITKEHIIQNSRKNELVLVRHIAIYVLNQETLLSQTEIGMVFERLVFDKVKRKSVKSGLHHTTIISALHKMDNIMEGRNYVKERTIALNIIHEYKQLTTSQG
jgi:hypothetical protein